MAIFEQQVGHYLVLAPQNRLDMDLGAKEFDKLLQERIAQGHIHVVVDLRQVLQLDSTGFRALVRAYTSASRLGGRFRLVGPSILLRRILEITRLASVLPIYDSVEAATRTEVSSGEA